MEQAPNESALRHPFCSPHSSAGLWSRSVRIGEVHAPEQLNGPPSEEEAAARGLPLASIISHRAPSVYIA
jgi:hypothetical protein